MTAQNKTRERGGGERLALLYQAFLVAAVRVQAGRQQVSDSQSFRKRMTAALGDVEQNAAVLGYSRENVQDAHLAVAAFLDEVVLGCGDELRAEWMRLPFAQEFLGQSMAGEAFFERLERLRSGDDAVHVADVLEVYLLCMLLGFEGRHSGDAAQLSKEMNLTGARLRQIRGERGRPLSPEGRIPDEPEAVPARQGSLIDRLTLSTGAALSGVVVLFLLYWIHLWAVAGGVSRALQVD